MSKPTRFLAACFLTIATALPGTAQEVTADTIVATVNGTDITVGHMIVLRQSLPEQYQNLDDSVLFQGILDQMVQQSVLAQTIETPSEAILIQLENERRALLAGAAMGVAIDTIVTEDAIQSAYEEQFLNSDPTREYDASHILVATQEEAQELVTQLQSGADFADLAREKSTGPSGPNGGELGWFGPGMMVPEFEAAVVDMQAGQVSDPVQTQFGWHVIKLNDTRVQAAPVLDEVRETLTDQLQQAAIEGIIADLTAKADVSLADVSGIDPAVLRQTELVQNRTSRPFRGHAKWQQIAFHHLHLLAGFLIFHKSTASGLPPPGPATNMPTGTMSCSPNLPQAAWLPASSPNHPPALRLCWTVRPSCPDPRPVARQFWSTPETPTPLPALMDRHR